MIKLKTLIREEEDKTKAVMTDFVEFAKNRLKGAEKIAKDAKKKGGDALLTYHHFDVKLPFYEDATKGYFDVILCKDKLKDKIKEVGLLSGPIHMEQIHFQRLLGEMEVLGELIIKWNELNLR